MRQASKITFLFWPLVALFFLKELPNFSSIVDRSKLLTHLRAIPLGVVGGLAISALLFFLISPWGFLHDTLQNSRPLIARKIRQLGLEDNFIWVAIFISFAHSAFEEYYWRFFVYQQSQSFISNQKSHLFAAFAFTIHHTVVLTAFFDWKMNLFLSLCVGTGGWLWSQLYAYQKSLMGAWVSHIIVDLALMWIGWQCLQ